MSGAPRVLMVTYWYPPAVGGVPSQTALLARALAAQGVDVSVATWRVGALKAEELHEGVRMHRLWTLNGGYRTRLYPWLFSLAAFLLQHHRRYDIFHVTQALYPAAVSVAVARLAGKKTVIKVSGSGATGNMSTLRERWLGWLARAIIKQADCLISLSHEINDELLESGFDLNQIVSVPNGVEVDLFRAAQPYAGRPAGPIVMTVGHLTKEKGLDVLLRAWAEVLKVVVAAQLVLVAEGPERAALTGLAEQLGIAPRVTFVGHVSPAEVPNYLAASTVFVLPSRSEGMANALLEALAAGRPCLASDIRANRELIQPGVNGLLFRTEDAEDLAAKLVELLGDEALRARLGAAALQTAVNRFSIDAVARQYLELYRALVENRPIPSVRSVPVERSPDQA